MRYFSLFFVLLATLLLPHSLEAASRKVPVRVQVVLMKVAPLLEKGRYEEALKVLNDHTRKSTTHGKHSVHPEISFALGNCYAMLEKQAQARKNYQKVVKEDPEHFGGWQNLAKTQYEMENFLQASKSFMKSYEISAKKRKASPQFLYFSAISLLMAQKYKEALTTFDMLLNKHPKAMTLAWQESLVYALLHANKPKRALPYMVELAEGFTGKKQQKWREIVLQQYMALDMYGKALLLATQLSREEPSVAIWWKGLTHIHLHQGKYKKALATMTIYSYLTELKEEEYTLLANLNMQLGIPKKAIPNYENCALEKSGKAPLLSLVRAYRAIDRLELALEKLERYKDQLDTQTLELERGEILYSLKRYKEAAIAYEKAGASPGKRSGMASLMAGYSHWQLEEFEAANHCFSQAVKEKRYAKEAQKAMERLSDILKSRKS